MSDVVERSLLIETLDPVITTDTPATLGSFGALPYIPGAMLHGLLVSRAYGKGWTNDQVFDLFNSGKLIVEDALPLGEDGNIGFPVPFCLYRPKACPAIDDGVLHGETMDFSEPRGATVGYAQCRGFAISSTGREIPVRTGTTLRTEINPATQAAAERQLFELHFLEPRQRFVSRLRVPDEKSEAVSQLLGDCGILGRSKSAEFGRVSFRLTESAWSVPEDNGGLAGDRYVWCLSDLWPEDANRSGQYLRGSDGLFGEMDWSGSFVRRRRYSAYNATWGCRTPEREVVVRGSVLKLTGASVSPGLYRCGMATEQGLGLVWVSDTPLGARIRGSEEPISVAIPTGETSEPRQGHTDNTLVDWLLRRASKDQATTTRPQAEEVRRLYEMALGYNGHSCGPGLSQWGRLREAAIKGDRDAIRDLFWHQQSQGTVADSDWNVGISTEPPKTILAWMIEQFPGLAADSQIAAAPGEMRNLAGLARDVRRRMQTEDWLDPKAFDGGTSNGGGDG